MTPLLLQPFKKECLFSCLLFLATCFSVQAQTRYYVNSSVTTSGDGKSWAQAFKTLQEAIDKTSSAATDEIWVAKGTYYPTKNVYGTIYEPPSWSRWMTFLITRPMKLYGGFAGTETTLSQRNISENITTLSGDLNVLNDSSDNVYHTVIILGTQAQPLDSSTTLDGFTVTGGYGIGTSGLTVNGETLDSYRGGGVLIKLAAAKLTNLTVTGNNANLGSGIYCTSSSAIISNCDISRNKAYLEGGGMYIASGSPVIKDCNISNNTSGTYGAGISESGSAAVLTNVTINNNTAQYDGGGISLSAESLQLNKVTLSGNKAREGGALFTSFAGSKASLNNCIITGNTAQYGASIRSQGSRFEITGGSITKNIAENFGGAAMLTGDTVNISGTLIDSNQAQFGGAGFYIEEEANVSFNDLTISNNKANNNGGGLIFYTNSTGSFKDVVISKNESVALGGGIYIKGITDSAHQSYFESVTFSENKSSLKGGGIYIENAGPVFKDVEFNNNTASQEGGGVMNVSGAYPTLDKVSFTGNRAGDGGGIFNESQSHPQITNSTFSGNTATGAGGAVYNEGGDLNYTNLTIKGNTAGFGAGMYIEYAKPVLTNILLSGNLSKNTGGGLYLYEASPVLTNVTVCSNKANSAGGGIYADGSFFGSTSKALVRNSIIYGNSTGFEYLNSNMQPDISYSLVQGINTTNNGNINGDEDPLFTEPVDYSTAPFTTGDYTLKGTSPVIDKGDSTLFDEGLTPDLSLINSDLAGNERVHAGNIDMGCYEYGASILPVTLVYLKAEKQKAAVKISWQTAVETNVAFFEVERSTNGQNFISISQVPAKGAGVYAYTDNHAPANQNVYYRLKVKDNDGSISFSNIVAVNNYRQLQDNMIVYPNPASSIITITDENKALRQGTVQIINTNGKIVLQTLANPVDVSRLAAGVYIVRITDNSGNTKTAKFVIRK